MNKEELIRKLHMIYAGDRNALEEMDGYYDGLKQGIEELQQENKQLKEEKRKVRDYINKHCVNEKISKEVGYKCYTMADTNELEKIMKILGDKDEIK